MKGSLQGPAYTRTIVMAYKTCVELHQNLYTFEFGVLNTSELGVPSICYVPSICAQHCVMLRLVVVISAVIVVPWLPQLLLWHLTQMKMGQITTMGWCKKDVTPLLMHWSYVFVVLTHRLPNSTKHTAWTQCLFLDLYSICCLAGSITT